MYKNQREMEKNRKESKIKRKEGEDSGERDLERRSRCMQLVKVGFEVPTAVLLKVPAFGRMALQ
jgi:hypothetical protein